MHKTKIMMLALALSMHGYGQTSFDCRTGFASTGVCGVAVNGQGGQAFQLTNAPSGVLSGSSVNLIPGSGGGGHNGSGLIYQRPLNVQAFTASYTYVPNGVNLAFVVENNTSAAGGGSSNNPKAFAAGAGCEGGFFQAYTSGTDPEVNNVFALELDQYSPLLNTAPYPYVFTHSSAQIYQASVSPCIAPYAGTHGTDFAPSKISTAPVSLNSPAGTGVTTTGDTYSVTVDYDGSNLTLSLYDQTLGGSCPGANCFTNTWSVNIPSLVGASTAYVGLTGGTNSNAAGDLLIKSFSYAPKTISPPQPTLASIAVTPINLSMLVGVTQQYTATCTKSDGTITACTSTVTWSSSDTRKALVSVSGLASGVAAGSSVIAAASGTVTGTSTLTVTAPPVAPNMTSLQVRPASATLLIGSTLQYVAYCGWSDATKTDCTGRASWSSSNKTKATITAAGGMATGVTTGGTSISARMGNFAASTNLTVKVK